MDKTRVRTDPSQYIQRWLEYIQSLLDAMPEAATEQLIQMILQANRIFITGKGRSGLIAECFAMRLMQIGFDVHVPGEATCPRIQEGDVMIAISCSGTTMTTVQLARISQDSNAKVVAVTAVPDSPLTVQAHHVVLVPVIDKGIKRYEYVLGPYNNTLFEEMLLLYFDGIVYSIFEWQGIPEKTLRERHTNLE